jgi:hypothetical protein
MRLQLLKLICGNFNNDLITNLNPRNSELAEANLYTIHSRIIYFNTGKNKNTTKFEKAEVDDDKLNKSTGLVIKNSYIDAKLLKYIIYHLDKKNIFLIELVGNEITKDGFDSLLAEFRKKETIRIIHFNGNNLLGLKSQDLILKLALQKNIEKLTLANIKLTTRGRVSFLDNYTNLKYININGLKLGLEGCKELNIYMKKFLKLNYLNLANNDIRSKGVNVLSNSIFMLKHLSYLNLSVNNICSECIPLLLSCLGENLEYLNLSENNIDFKGVGLIANALPTALKNLKTFFFSNNKIGNSVCLTLLNGFCEMKKLMNLDLSNNRLTDEIAEDLKTMIKEMNLVYFNLRGNNIKRFYGKEDLKIIFN